MSFNDQLGSDVAEHWKIKKLCKSVDFFRLVHRSHNKSFHFICLPDFLRTFKFTTNLPFLSIDLFSAESRSVNAISLSRQINRSIIFPYSFELQVFLPERRQFSYPIEASLPHNIHNN